MKNSNNTIGNRTRNLPAWRINLMNLSLQVWILNIVAPDLGACLKSSDNKETVLLLFFCFRPEHNTEQLRLEIT